MTIVCDEVLESIETLKEFLRIEELDRVVERAAALMKAAVEERGRIFVCGNGGSAAQASHLAAELMVRFRQNRYPIPCVALTTDPAVMTAAANDYGYDRVFERQVEALGLRGDVLVVISTSGRSPNVLNAIAAAKHRELTTIALTGSVVTTAISACDVVIPVPSKNTARIQEVHQVVIHALCAAIEGDPT